MVTLDDIIKLSWTYKIRINPPISLKNLTSVDPLKDIFEEFGFFCDFSKMIKFQFGEKDAGAYTKHYVF